MRGLALVIKAVLILVIAILWLRFVVQFFGASLPPITGWIMEASNFFLAPFRGFFPSIRLWAGNIVEFNTLFAIVIYEFLKFIIARAFRLNHG